MGIHSEIVLYGNRRVRDIFGLYFQTLLRLDSLMESVAPPPTDHYPSGVGVDNFHFSFAHDIVDIAFVEGKRPQQLRKKLKFAGNVGGAFFKRGLFLRLLRVGKGKIGVDFARKAFRVRYRERVGIFRFEKNLSARSKRNRIRFFVYDIIQLFEQFEPFGVSEICGQFGFGFFERNVCDSHFEYLLENSVARSPAFYLKKFFDVVFVGTSGAFKPFKNSVDDFRAKTVLSRDYALDFRQNLAVGIFRHFLVGARNNKGRARLVHKNRVGLVHKTKEETALDFFVGSGSRGIVAQIVETEFGRSPVSDVGGVGLLFFADRLSRINV